MSSTGLKPIVTQTKCMTYLSCEAGNHYFRCVKSIFLFENFNNMTLKMGQPYVVYYYEMYDNVYMIINLIPIPCGYGSMLQRYL